MQIKHVLIESIGCHFSDNADYICSFGKGLWTFDNTGHGDQYQSLIHMYGCFTQSNGYFYFKYDTPLGTKLIALDPENDLYVKEVEFDAS